MNRTALACVLVTLATPALPAGHSGGTDALMGYGPRPLFLISKMEDGALKDTLMSCAGQEMARTKFSIGHRGAPLMFPEHTVESNMAAAATGAGILECDVTFTADRELVCRHAQNDLHTTTDIVATELGAKCTTPFMPASGEQDATAECRTSDLTLAEFRTLNPKMDAANPRAETAEAYLDGTAAFRTDLYAGDATLLTHAESIALFDSMGADFTPELKSPTVEMPFDGFTMDAYAQKMIDEYKAAGIDPSRVWPQSFDLDVVKYWIDNEPEFGRQAVYLMDEYDIEGYDPDRPGTWPNSMAELKEMGVNVIAPPLWMLVKVEDGEIVPNALANEAKATGLQVITWSFERAGPLAGGGGWYFTGLSDVIDRDGDYYELLDVLAQDVGVIGVFSDWPASVTYYANCMGL